MQKYIRRFSAVLIMILAFAAAVIITSCEGSDARKAIDDTVEEASGGGLIKKGEKIKQEIRDLNAQEIERIQKDIEKGVYSEEE